MHILGISCFYHDAAAVILRDGMIIAAAQEERFTRKKHDPSFPTHAIEYCLKEAGITIDQVDTVAFYDKPFLKFERLLETYLAYVPKGLRSAWEALPIWIKEKLWIEDTIRTKLNFTGRMMYTEHHESHAASAFFPSPFEEAAIITMDGVGEWATSTLGVGKGNTITLTHEQHFPHSLGLLYSAFTYYCGFKVNSGEYKLMGLAPYGKPIYADLIFEHLIDLKEDGSFLLNQRYFNYSTGMTMTNRRFATVFGAAPRKPETPISQRDMDLAASVQVVTEEVVRRVARFITVQTGLRNVVMAGGVALNCVANGMLLKEKIVDRLWIQPAAGDAGGALGAALFAWYQVEKQPRVVSGADAMRGSLLGPQYSQPEILQSLEPHGAVMSWLPPSDIDQIVAKAIADGQIVGWFQGRMEFGPRALGARSILGDPRSPDMQRELNVNIKFRESFRPFAPAVLADKAKEYFDLDEESPYMLIVADVDEARRKPMDPAKTGFDRLYELRSDLPAITHIDYSARVQTVSADRHPRFTSLITAFGALTGCPVLINTSFNVRGEPIVNTPEDAYRCFMRTNMDVLVIENAIFYKKDQPETGQKDEWKEEFPLD
jgi:carbamoyltransferase